MKFQMAEVPVSRSMFKEILMIARLAAPPLQHDGDCGQMMRWTTTAEARLDEGKATACALGSPSNPTIWLQTGVVALNFVERRPDETENHAQRARNPRVWVYTWRALGLIDAVARSPFPADGRRSAATTCATSGFRFARHPDSGYRTEKHTFGAAMVARRDRASVRPPAGRNQAT
jgi:hypothetical protein